MIKTNIKIRHGYTEDDLVSAVCGTLPVTKDEINSLRIIKRKTNINNGKDLCYDVTLELGLSPEREAGLMKMKKKVLPADDFSFSLPALTSVSRPVVVGAGPSGLFAALALSMSGLRPILYERGLAVEERTKRVELFNKLSILDTECNIQYGEGGAGTFSDGKLKVGAKDKYKSFILEKFIEYGAAEDIYFSDNAHVGTDKLSLIVKRIREEIISLGGEVHFGSRLTYLSIKEGRLLGGSIEREGREESFETDTLILAAGHSAEDTFELLKKSGAVLTPRSFGMGLRIEHKREYIDKLVYKDIDAVGLGAASYHLVTHLENGRSVYSFCNCPGGTVVAAASREGGIVTNGMSEYARDGENSNAAFLVSLTPADFGSEDPLSGIYMQRRIERATYSLTDSYKAPSIRMEDFLNNTAPTHIGSIKPTYPIGTELFKPESYLPDIVTDSLRAAMPEFDAWLSGFIHPDAMMTGAETRSTSPVRVERNEGFEAELIKGLYPIGEGAGYSGGIVSSARDGLMAAESIILKKSKHL